MAFDFHAPIGADLETLLDLIKSKAPADDKRRAALAAYDGAMMAPDATLDQWRTIATALAALVPAPKAKPAPAPVSGLEWCSYTEAQAKGAASAFYGQRWAAFRFADGQTVTVTLRHKKSLDLPDWARAARCAVSFYKAARARCFLRLVGESYGNAAPSLAERYANGCEVPAIVSAHDLARDSWADPDQCNAATATEREGPRYLAELITLACEAGGDWAEAWLNARLMLDTAEKRDRKARDAARLLAADAAEPLARQKAITAALPIAERLGQVFRLITAPDWRATIAELQTAA